MHVRSLAHSDHFTPSHRHARIRAVGPKTVMARAEAIVAVVPMNIVPLIGSPVGSTSVPSLVNMMVGGLPGVGPNATGLLIRPKWSGVSDNVVNLRNF